ncbi:MAG: beta-ketoacyl synthase N-terminal-like domain-containing protein, partial [Bacteroidota bacterium]
MPYLDRIDLFDAAFFNITPGEAKRMTPEQRIFLEEAVKCFFSATKSLDDIRGSKTGIFSSLANSQYGLLNTSNSNSSMAELDAAMNVTRLAHLFDLRGPAITVETTCSSALVALHQACQSLRDGTCEMALVGGINIALCSKENVLSSPVTSNDFDCRAFDAAANGTISGEGIVLALLQPLSEAIRESNPVFGIVKGSAINHGGARISNITAPSPEAQAEVLQQAWKNADVEGADLAWIEAHGTGTLLGDPIEIQGMVKALAKEGQSKTACAVGAVKSQFGHLNGAAGMLGLAKVVLSGQHDMIPPMTRFEQVNPAIDAADTGLYFPTSKAPWPSDRPYAGVSSFGLSGTNAHVVLKKYKEEWGAAIPDFLYVLQLCAVNEKVGDRIRQYLCDLIKADPNPSRVQSIVRAFNKIALQSENSQLYVADSVDDLLEALQATSSLSTTVKEDHQLYAFLSSDSFIEPLVFEKLGSIFPPIFTNYHQLATSVDYPLGEEEQNVLRLLAYHQWLVSLGASFDKLIVNGRAQHLSDFLNGNINLSQALQAWTGASEPHLLKKKAFQAFVDSIAQSSATAAVHLGMGCLGQLLTPALSSRCQLVGTSVESALESMTFLHHWSGPLQTAHLYGSKGKRHSLVIDPFQRERHWPEVTKRTVEPLVEASASTPETAETPAFQSEAEVQKLVRDIWTDCLQLDDPISLDADFFEIGGSSLMGLDVLDDIKKYTNVDLDYEDIFDHPTIFALSKHLMSFLGKEESVKEKFQPSKPLPIEEKDYQQLLEKTQQADVKSVV